MLDVTERFTSAAEGSMRPVSYRVTISFDKQIDENIDFFTIGVSSIGGTDFIKGDGSAIQEWDKYTYTDYSDRVISIEWSRVEDRPYSVAQAMATVVLDNHDDFFTPSDISPVLPGRPIRIYAGFDNDEVQVFVGLTQKLPKVDESNKTVTFECLDFLTFALDKPLEEAVIYQDERVDVILDDLLVLHSGLSSLQLDLDVGFNTIPFAFFDKGTKVGDAIRKLVQADLGSLFMTEEGTIRFRNRQGFDDTSVGTFDNSNINELTYREQSDIINVVEVKSDVREVQDNQKLWESTTATPVTAGSTVEIWADFTDPVTACDDPVFYNIATTSSYRSTLEDTGEGTDYSSITLVSTDLFSKSFKMTFQNTGASNAYIRNIQLWATPAKVVSKLYVREQDDDSVDKYEEQVFTVQNEYIQNETDATSMALTLLSFYSEPSEISVMGVKGHPALQLGDTVTSSITQGLREITRPFGILLAITKTGETITVDEREFLISKIDCQITSHGEFKQILTLRPQIDLSFFTIGVSSIGGSDVISP